MTYSYWAIFGYIWSKIGPKLTPNGQKHTIRPVEPVKTKFLLPFKKQSIIFHVKVPVKRIETQIYSVILAFGVNNWPKVGQKRSKSDN